MLRFALTIFLSAFLLFQVQPLIGKYILPWFGGTNNVWTTCLLFFQIVLLGGYAYAHFLGKLPKKKQALVHLVLLCLTLPFLPIAPSVGWKPGPEHEPTLRILLLLAATLGLPYLVLSTTGPLLQNWFSVSNPGKSPYRLYALSNVGSLLALISFPIWVEPNLTRWQQVLFWSIGFGGFALCCGWCAVVLWKGDTPDETQRAGVGPSGPVELDLSDDRTAPKSLAGGVPPAPVSPSPFLILLWLLLAASGSAIMLATTNQLTGDVAVVPFLWIIPLALYLITFIICFDSDWWYIRPVFGALLLITVPIAVYLLFEGVTAPLTQQIIGYSAAMFACCMTCHGELARSRPHPKYLTLFYLTISAGGALGGLVAAVCAPMTFTPFHEYHVALFGCVGITFVAWFRDAIARPLPGRTPALGYFAALTAFIIAVVALFLVAEQPVTDWSGQDKSVFTQMKEGALEFWSGAMNTRVFESPGAKAGTTGYLQSSFIKFSVMFGLVIFVAALITDEYLHRARRRPVLFLIGPALAAAFLGIRLIDHVTEDRRGVDYVARNFYGVLQVESAHGYRSEFENEDGDMVYEDVGPKVRLVHGRIMHGFQYRHENDPNHFARRWHTSYYGETGGVGMAILHHPKRDAGDPMHIGVIGLGTGTTATYGRKGDRVRIYEINPIVEHIARTYFTYLGDSPADVKVVLGDARIMLERELDRGEPQQFDVLAVDAFSSDAIPIHLLTKECVELYFKHIKDDGILALHISNRFVELEGVTMALAEAMNKKLIYVSNRDDDSKGINGSTWVLLTSNESFANNEDVLDVAESWRLSLTVTEENIEDFKDELNEAEADKLKVGDKNPLHKPLLWTDDFASLWELLDF